MLPDTVYTLWDELAEYPASEIDASLNHLLSTLCELLQCKNAYWLGAIRMDDPSDGDPYQGWRPARVHYLHNDASISHVSQQLIREVQKGEHIDPVAEQVKQAGCFRVHTLSDIMAPDFFQSEHYRVVYLGRGYPETLFVVVPLNDDAEAYFALHRGEATKFSHEEYQLAGATLRGLRWYLRQLFLSHGLLIGEKPLSPAQRRVLHQLLTCDSEAEIARRLDLSPATVHTYVKVIYRSLGVRSRAALAALWLGGEGLGGEAANDSAE